MSEVSTDCKSEIASIAQPNSSNSQPKLDIHSIVTPLIRDEKLYLWDGRVKGFVGIQTEGPPSKKLKKNNSRKNENGQFQCDPKPLAASIIENLTKFYHFTFPKLTLTIIKNLQEIIQPLNQFFGGEKEIKKIIRGSLRKINDRINSRLESVLSTSIDGVAMSALTVEILNCAYGNAVELNGNQRAMEITEILISTYQQHLDMSRKDRRKITYDQIQKYKEENEITINDVELYHRFGASDRNSSSLGKYRRHPRRRSLEEDVILDGWESGKETVPIAPTSEFEEPGREYIISRKRKRE